MRQAEGALKGALKQGQARGSSLSRFPSKPCLGAIAGLFQCWPLAKHPLMAAFDPFLPLADA